MKIYINGRFLTQSVTGVQRYAREVVLQLDRITNQKEYRNNEIVILTPKNCTQRMNLARIKIKSVGHFNGHLWEQLELPFYSRKGLLVNLCNVAPMFRRNQIVTVHDASVFLPNGNFSYLFKLWYQLIIKLECLLSKNIVTVSKFSRDELIRYVHVKKNKMTVTYEGNEHIKDRDSDDQILEKYVLGKKPYLLAVSSMDPRKNFENVVKAIELLENKNVNFVIAGGTNPHVFKSKNFNFPDNVKYLGYISDEELKALYENAYCFIYPSFYEGFGLPPLEAMTLGCPVIISDRASLPEIFDDAALYCKPEDPIDIKEKIDYLFKHEEVRNELKEKGIEKAAHYSWYNCAEELWAIIQSS
ncbi:MAG: glycosyltransferase [Neobacillus sp.]|nr:glycosyltransferase [Neobacillus sp.]